MSAVLSEDQIAVRDGARRFAKVNFGPACRRSLRESADGYDEEVARRATADGWLSVMVAPGRGGSGQGLQEACLVAEEFGRELSPFQTALAIVCRWALSMFPESANGVAEQAAGDVSACVTITASGATANLTCGADGSQYQLSGACRQTPDAAAARYVLVEAEFEGAPALLVVKRQARGVSISARRSVDGGSIGEISFDCVQVKACDVLFGSSADTVIRHLRASLSILAAAELIGIMDAALMRTVEHLRTRHQFGKPLGSFQALQFRMADIHSALSLSRALTYEAARLADGNSKSANVAASMAIAKAAESAIWTTRTYIQMLGAMGFTDEHEAGLYLKRTMTLATAFGTSLEHRRRIGAATLASQAGEIRFREDGQEEQAFRQEVRDWLEQNLPKRLRHLPTRPTFEDACFWHRMLYERGWIAPNWPREFGGMEASVAQQIILAEELGRIGAPEISGQAIGHLGPILHVFGTAEQKKKHLPGMLSGEKLWCQGYSEPSSGSDLASLRTRAHVEGSDLVINGSKIWTTWAHYADWMFCLVRTNPNVKKQEGLTFVLIDMKTKGVNARPIRTITGEDEFAEVFLDDVRTPISNVVGEIDGGWRVATALLEKERLNGANPQKCSYLLGKVKAAARMSGVIDDPAFRDRLVGAEIDYVALCATYAQIVKITETDMRTNADFAFAKLVAAELLQELCELMLLALGPDGACVESLDVNGAPLNAGLTYLQTRRATIYGGTAEIQRMLMARRVLGLV